MIVLSTWLSISFEYFDKYFICLKFWSFFQNDLLKYVLGIRFLHLQLIVQFVWCSSQLDYIDYFSEYNLQILCKLCVYEKVCPC